LIPGFEEATVKKKNEWQKFITDLEDNSILGKGLQVGAKRLCKKENSGQAKQKLDAGLILTRNQGKGNPT
jgi:hypothetical protein